MAIGILVTAVTLMGMLGLLVAGLRMESAPAEPEAAKTLESDLRRAA